jgi:nicotinate-nucleotide adenylyltransferase
MFDPPHLGHLEIARFAYNKVNPESLIWIPAKYPPHRYVRGLSANDRVTMLKWWFRNKPEFEVSDIELSGHSGYSIETIERFKKKYPDVKIYFLIGSDEAEHFKSWKSWDKIIKITTLIIGRRKEGANIPLEIKRNAILLDNKIWNISSTEIRERLVKNESVKGRVDEEIIDYINKNSLYI